MGMAHKTTTTANTTTHYTADTFKSGRFFHRKESCSSHNEDAKTLTDRVICMEPKKSLGTHGPLESGETITGVGDNFKWKLIHKEQW